MKPEEKSYLFNLVGSIYGEQAISLYIPSDLAAESYGVDESVILSLIGKHEIPVYKMPEKTVFLNPNCFQFIGKALNKPYKKPFTYADLISGRCIHCRQVDADNKDDE